MLHEQRFFFLASKAIAFALSRVYGRLPFTGYLTNVIHPTFSVRFHHYKGAGTGRELTWTTACCLHASFLVDALCAVGQRYLTAMSVPCVLSFLCSSLLGASLAFTDDIEDASAGVRGATPAASQSGSRRSLGSDGLLMLYAAGVGLPVRGPGSGASSLSAADAHKPGCKATLPLVAVGGLRWRSLAPPRSLWPGD